MTVRCVDDALVPEGTDGATPFVDVTPKKSQMRMEFFCENCHWYVCTQRLIRFRIIKNRNITRCLVPDEITPAISRPESGSSSSLMRPWRGPGTAWAMARPGSGQGDSSTTGPDSHKRSHHQSPYMQIKIICRFLFLQRAYQLSHSNFMTSAHS